MLTKEQEIFGNFLGKLEQLRVRSKLISFQKKKLREDGNHGQAQLLDYIQEGESFIYWEMIKFAKQFAEDIGLPENYLSDHSILYAPVYSPEPASQE